METSIKDSERYYNSFIKEVEDYMDLSMIQYYIKYVANTIELHDIRKDYESYSKYRMQEDELDFDEWLEKVYYEKFQDEIEERVYEYNQSLDIVIYTSNEWYKYIELWLTLWWHNVWININTRWNKAEYEFHWCWDNLIEDISYLYDTLINMYRIDE